MQIKPLYKPHQENRLELVAKLIFFIIWPFGAFLVSLLDVRSKSSYAIYFLFGVVFCWSMYSVNNGIDFEQITLRFYEQQGLDFSDIIDKFRNLYDSDSKDKDIYNMALNWTVLQFTKNFHVLFAIAAIPFLYFMLKSLSMITDDRLRFDCSLYCYAIALLFILPKDIFDVQNFRFATATWASVYGTLKLFYFQKRKYIFLLLALPLIHASFWLYTAIVFLYILSKKVKITYLYYASIPFAVIYVGIPFDLDFNALPGFLAHWAESYTSDEAQKLWGMAKQGSGYYWVADAFSLFKFAMYTYATISIIKSQELKKASPNAKNIFSFYLAYATIVNFIQMIPVLGGRFLNNTFILAVFCWFKIMYPQKNKIIKWLLISWIFDILYTKGGHYAMVTDWDFYLTDLISIILKYWNVTTY